MPKIFVIDAENDFLWDVGIRTAYVLPKFHRGYYKKNFKLTKFEFKFSESSNCRKRI